jgi:hypothetical protein
MLHGLLLRNSVQQLPSNQQRGKTVFRAAAIPLFWVLKDIQQSFGIRAIGSQSFRVYDVDKLMHFVFQLAIKFAYT